VADSYDAMTSDGRTGSDVAVALEEIKRCSGRASIRVVEAFLSVSRSRPPARRRARPAGRMTRRMSPLRGRAIVSQTELATATVDAFAWADVIRYGPSRPLTACRAR